MPARYLPVLVLIAAALVAVAFFASATYLVLLTDGLLVAAVVLAGAGWGAWLTVALGFGRRPPAQQFCLAVGLGLGVLSTIALALGAAGLLSRTVCCGLMGCGRRAGDLTRLPRAVAVTAIGHD